MHLEPYVARLRAELATAAEAGGEEARQLAERLTAPLEPAIRLALLEALSVAAEEITLELAPGSVDVRLRKGEPEFVVAQPPAGPEAEPDRRSLMERLIGIDAYGNPVRPAATDDAKSGAKDGTMARINLRLPENLKAQAEQAAEREGMSVNAWLVRTVAEAVGQATAEPDQGPGRRTPPRGQHYTGWAR